MRKRIYNCCWKTNKEIKENNLGMLKSHLKLPVMSPLIYISIFVFFLFSGVALIYAERINNMLLKTIVCFLYPSFIPAILTILILFTWGSMPEENITNGLKTIDLKHQNLILRRRRKKYLKLLSAPFDNWSKDERIEIKFVSYES
ncbi:MAG: hypothetical protein R2883_02120 [Caldisericia bacterium]